MTGQQLKEALKTVNWVSNIDHLCGAKNAAARIEHCNMRLAHWAKQIEAIEHRNPAIAFVREMQHGGYSVAACISLALYKPAASSMRSLLECALYYTYFRSHPAELATLLFDEKYYVSKREILLFFQKHVREFQPKQAALNYVERLERWYSETSSIIHGQIPGQWNVGASLGEIYHHDNIMDSAVEHFERAVGLVQDTFICTVTSDIWAFVESESKAFICKGMPGNIKAALKLDVA